MCYIQNQLWGSLLRIMNQGGAQGGKRGSGVEPDPEHPRGRQDHPEPHPQGKGGLTVDVPPSPPVFGGLWSRQRDRKSVV